MPGSDDIQNVDQNTLPDLPGLETVEEHEARRLYALVFFSIFCLFFISGFIYRYYAGLPIEAPTYSFAIYGVVLLVLILLVAYRTTFAVRCDSSGITLGLWRKRFMAWSEIVSARTIGRAIHLPKLELRTATGRRVIRCPGNGPMGDIVLAAIWQHLRRLGQANEIKLTPRALSLWQEIPAEVPEELEYIDRMRRPAAVGGVIFFAAMVAGAAWIGAGIFQHPDPVTGFFALLAIFFFAMLRYVLLPSILRIPARMQVGADGIQAELPFAKVNLAWEDISRARWFNSQYFIVRADGSNREIWFFHTLFRADAETLILAVIRHLRQKQPTLIIPLPRKRELFKRQVGE
jgi:hypothetical protein